MKSDARRAHDIEVLNSPADSRDLRFLPGDDRRTAPRIDGTLLRSNLGPVLDISRTGMRVVARSVPEDVVEVYLGDGDSSIQLQARVAWSRKIGFFKHMLGLEFVEASDAVTKWLLSSELTARTVRVV